MTCKGTKSTWSCLTLYETCLNLKQYHINCESKEALLDLLFLSKKARNVHREEKGFYLISVNDQTNKWLLEIHDSIFLFLIERFIVKHPY